MPLSADRLIPRAGRVLVRRTMKPEMTEGGIILPETTRMLSQAGEVISLGRGVDDLSVGDEVIFSVYGAVPCIATTDNDELLFVSESAIMAVISEDQGAAVSGNVNPSARVTDLQISVVPTANGQGVS